MNRYAHLDMTPPKAARDAAQRFVAAWTPEAADHTIVGHHARAVASGKPVTAATVRFMAGPLAPQPQDANAPPADLSGLGGEQGIAWAKRLSVELDAADRAARAGDGPHTGVAVVLPVDGATADYLALPGGLPASEHHVTLAFLGKTSDFAPGDDARLLAVLSAWASDTPPLPAMLSGIGRFVAPAGEPDPCYLSVDAPGLTAAREDLVGRLRDAGFDVKTSHGFDPHLTLQYLPQSAPTPSPLPYLLPVAVRFDRVALWFGDDRSQGADMVGTADPRTLDAREVLHGEGVAILFDAGGEPEVGHTTWNQIARLGTFLGHPQGPVSFTPRVFDEIIQNHVALLNGEVPGDYEHTSERLPARAAVDGVPAPFWVRGIEKRGAGGSELWSAFEWVDPVAVGYVRSKQYKYLSPAVNFAAKSRATGKPIGARLTSVALTNHPFIDGLAPVTASARPSTEERLADAFGQILDDTRATHLHSPSPDALHAPSFGHATPTPAPRTPMPNEATTPATMTAAPAEGAPATATDDVTVAKAAEAEKAAAAAGDARMRFPRMMAECLQMADAPVDPEALENALLEKIRGMVAALEANQKREAEAQMSVAKTMSARVIAAGLAAPGSEERLTTLCFSQRETFDAIYPIALVEEVEKTRAALAAKPKEGAALFAEQRGAAEAVAVLTQRTGAAGGAQPSTQGAAENPTVLLDARALDICKADPTIGYLAARTQAEREAAEKTAR